MVAFTRDGGEIRGTAADRIAAGAGSSAVSRADCAARGSWLVEYQRPQKERRSPKRLAAVERARGYADYAADKPTHFATFVRLAVKSIE